MTCTDALDDAMDTYQLQVWAVPLMSGGGYLARLAVRRMPTLSVVFEDESLECAGGWALPQQAMAAALDRGRQFIRTEAASRATAVQEHAV